MSQAAKGIFSQTIGELLQFYKDTAKAELLHWNNKKSISKLFQHIDSIRKVKTIWQMERSIDLLSFYHPSKLAYDKSKIQIDSINAIPITGNLLIEGVAGQGKSIFLRYLCAVELKESRRVPIFIELRRIEEGEDLMTHIVRVFTNYGLEFSEEVFQVLAQSKRLILLLDGFDEVAESAKMNLIGSLETISVRFPDLRIIVTSRPDWDLRKSTFFRTVRLAPLEGTEYEAVIGRLLEKETSLKIALLKSIRAHKGGISSLLTTPLMVTLLTLTYQSYKEIPSQLSEFYDSLFHLLLQRHDNLKIAYRRARVCKIANHQFRQLFDALCFFSKAKRAEIFTEAELLSYIERAAVETNVAVRATDFLEDIIRITCLILKEGTEYRYIHKSVHEFHTAAYLKSKPDSVVEKFYKKAAVDLTDYLASRWNAELGYLREIDTFRFYKYALIPSVQKMAGNPSTNCTADELTKKLLEAMHAKLHMVEFSQEKRIWERKGFELPPLGLFFMVFLRHIQKLRSYHLDAAKLNGYCNRLRNMQDPQLNNIQITCKTAEAECLAKGPAYEDAKLMADDIYKEYETACEYVSAKERDPVDEVIKDLT